MKVVLATVLGIALTSLVLVPRSLAQDSTDAVQAKVLALENAWNVAEAHHDTQALDHLMSYSMVYIEQDGTLMDKAQFLASVKKQAASQEKIVTESVTAPVYGTTAIVVGVYRVAGVEKGKPFSHRGRFIDTWIEDGGNWQCVSAQATLISNGN